MLLRNCALVKNEEELHAVSDYKEQIGSFKTLSLQFLSKNFITLEFTGSIAVNLFEVTQM